MLPPFIIDQIRRREEQEQERPSPRPTIELPIPDKKVANTSEEKPKRGVVVIDLV